MYRTEHNRGRVQRGNRGCVCHRTLCTKSLCELREGNGATRIVTEAISISMKPHSVQWMWTNRRDLNQLGFSVQLNPNCSVYEAELASVNGKDGQRGEVTGDS